MYRKASLIKQTLSKMKHNLIKLGLVHGINPYYDNTTLATIQERLRHKFCHDQY